MNTRDAGVLCLLFILGWGIGNTGVGTALAKCTPYFIPGTFLLSPATAKDGAIVIYGEHLQFVELGDQKALVEGIEPGPLHLRELECR